MKQSFDEKISEYFSTLNISLKDKPARHLIHLYADYVEIVSLFSNYNIVSKSDILDRLKEDGGLKIEKIDIELDFDMNEDTKLGILKKDGEGELEYIEHGERNDKNQILVDTVFHEIKNRTYLYRNDYPFEMIDGDIVLKNSANLSERNRIYLFLLLSSNLNLFHIFEPELTSEFELVSYFALKMFMPNHAEVKSFGKNSDYPNGTAIDKIKNLAKDLKITVDEGSLSQISPKGTQERGLDLIAWIPFDDYVANYITILCQCACGKEWYRKLSETGRYENYFNFFRHSPVHAMFVPYSLIDYHNSSFYQSDEIRNTLFFDRKRILSSIKDDIFFNNLKSKIIVNKCIEYEEDIV